MVETEFSASPVLPWKIRPSCVDFHPFPHHLWVLREKRELQSQPWGRYWACWRRQFTSSASQMLSTAGGTVRTLLRLLRILEFLHPLTPLGVYTLSIGLENPQTPVPRVGSLSTSQPKVLFIKRGVPSNKQAFWGSASPREIIAFHMLQASGRSLWSRDFLVQASDLACQSCRRTPKLKLHQAAAKNVPSG